MLLILVVLGAMGVVWKIAVETIGRSTSDVASTVACIGLSVHLTESVVFFDVLDGVKKLRVTVKRNPGGGDVTDLRFTTDGQAWVSKNVAVWEVLSTKTFVLKIADVVSFPVDLRSRTIQVVPVVRTEEGQGVVCENAVAERVIT